MVVPGVESVCVGALGERASGLEATWPFMLGPLELNTSSVRPPGALASRGEAGDSGPPYEPASLHVPVAGSNVSSRITRGLTVASNQATADRPCPSIDAAAMGPPWPVVVTPSLCAFQARPARRYAATTCSMTLLGLATS